MEMCGLLWAVGRAENVFKYLLAEYDLDGTVDTVTA